MLDARRAATVITAVATAVCPLVLAGAAAPGTWGTAKEVRGIAALGGGGDALTSSVSCGPGGNCAAGGIYTGGSRHQQAFVVDQPPG